MYDDYSPFLVKRFKDLFGKNFNRLMGAYSKRARKAIRVNTLKISSNNCLNRLKRKGFKLSDVPWCKYAFFVDKEPSPLAGTVEHMMGFFYIQDATSLVPVIELNPKPGEIVLDMAAAPGGKTTHMSQLMKNKGSILAMDVDNRRIKALLYNAGRTGAENIIFMRDDARNVKNVGLKFDKILLDAPCTADGTISKNPELKKDLTQEYYKIYPEKQKALLKAAKSVLKKNGALVYATCSTAPEENEEIVEFAVEHLGYQLEQTKLQKYFDKGWTRFFGKAHKSYLSKSLRIMPYKYNTQAFFVAKFKLPAP